MSLLITIVGVGLGVLFAGVVNRRFGVRSPTAWLLIFPVAVVYAVVGFAGSDMSDPVPRAVQAFAIGALMQTAIDGFRADRQRRRRVNEAEEAIRRDQGLPTA